MVCTHAVNPIGNNRAGAAPSARSFLRCMPHGNGPSRTIATPVRGGDGGTGPSIRPGTLSGEVREGPA